MKKVILLLALMTTISLSANPFSYMRIDTRRIQQQISQKFIYAQRAAAQGNVRAQFDLAMMYARGDGVRRSEREAFKWFHKAARNNHREAKFYMGLSFAQGRGVRKQAQLARYWFKLAAKAGHRQAMAYLASLERSLRVKSFRGHRISFNTYR